MARTLADYIDIAEHAVGGQLDASVGIEQVVNDAGRYLIQMADWAFLERPQAMLDTVQGQGHLDLPADFHQLIAIGNTASYYTYAVRLLPADQFERIRSTNITDLLDIYLSLEWPGQSGATSAAPAPRLKIYPVPSTSVTGRYWLNYKAGWTELSAMDAVPNIPGPMEHLLVQLVRAFARGEASGEGPYELIEGVERSGMLARMKEAYGLVNPTPAAMEGGAIQCLPDQTHHQRQHRTITTKA